jgi:hypothetical protein
MTGGWRRRLRRLILGAAGQRQKHDSHDGGQCVQTKSHLLSLVVGCGLAPNGQGGPRKNVYAVTAVRFGNWQLAPGTWLRPAVKACQVRIAKR